MFEKKFRVLKTYGNLTEYNAREDAYTDYCKLKNLGYKHGVHFFLRYDQFTNKNYLYFGGEE